MIDRNGMLKVTHVIRMQQQGHGQAQGMVLDWAGAGAGGGSAFTQVRSADKQQAGTGVVQILWPKWVICCLVAHLWRS